MIQTVLGPVTAEQLGRTYCHEHLRLDLSKVRNDADSVLNDSDLMVAELACLAPHTVQTIVDVTNREMGRDVTALVKISQTSGLQIVCSTGFYKQEYYPAWLAEKSMAAIAEYLIEELTVGIDASGIRAGIIAEIGAGLGMVRPLEEKVFWAAALAQQKTGAPISTHCEMGTTAREQAEILLQAGANPQKVILGHLDLCESWAILESVLKQGFNIAFDTVGKNKYRTKEERCRLLRNVIDKGYAKQLVLSQDITRKSHLRTYGGYGYAYLFEDFLPEVCSGNEADELLQVMLVENPARILDVVGLK